MLPKILRLPGLTIPPHWKCFEMRFMRPFAWSLSVTPTSALCGESYFPPLPLNLPSPPLFFRGILFCSKNPLYLYGRLVHPVSFTRDHVSICEPRFVEIIAIFLFFCFFTILDNLFPLPKLNDIQWYTDTLLLSIDPRRIPHEVTVSPLLVWSHHHTPFSLLCDVPLSLVAAKSN